ncbi:HtaA domain-containing protein [Leucobacter triazinivorans]|uniref:Htaa domain-containing protein n=1 Tax=Leucobacter triazinivorans TaxID=1784719 RepID=A0A4P6KG62_9MICO|nr:HtaA domain-containing protein [Leucobacter triazinivorans]QBE49485.1 hypothetical protein EVS81_12095 [Leucobacter triazinivorans]
MARRMRGAVAAVSVLGAALLAAPTAATATSSAAPTSVPFAAEAAGECVVESAQLNWGIKESFRSYISGSIANGDWTTSDDMRYETPSFIWTESEGAIAPDLSGGSILFTGAVQFTGHDGALEFDLADPGIEFEDERTAYLLVRIGATDAAAEGGTVESELVRAAKIDLAGVTEASGARLDIDGAVPVLTSEGAAAFNGEYGSYVSGDELDPIVLTATVGGCSLSPSAPTAEGTPTEEQPAAEEAAPISAPEQSIPWLPIGIGAVALLVIGVTGGMLIAGRGRTRGAADPENADTPSE